MTDYAVQAALATDARLMDRIKACAAGQGIPDPVIWVGQHVWELAVRPGWCCAATDAAQADHKHDQVGITDAMILAAVTEIRAAEAPPE